MIRSFLFLAHYGFRLVSIQSLILNYIINIINIEIYKPTPPLEDVLKMKWPIHVPPGEESIFLSIIISLSLVILTILGLWIWPELLVMPAN
jgi:hypothetical protein